MKKIKVSDLQIGRNGYFTLSCVKNWIEMYGLSWETFLLEGYTFDEIYRASPKFNKRVKVFRVFCKRNNLI